MTRLSLYLVTLLLGTHFPSTTVPRDQPAMVSPAPLMAYEQRSADMVNMERRARGLQELSMNPLLVRIAREHSREMYEKNYFDHVSPTPGIRTPKDRYLKGLGGYVPTWACISENLFYCSIVDVDRGHEAFMNSAPHRDNILNERFDQIGVGVFIAPDGRFWVTQIFLNQID